MPWILTGKEEIDCDREGQHRKRIGQCEFHRAVRGHASPPSKGRNGEREKVKYRGWSRMNERSNPVTARTKFICVGIQSRFSASSFHKPSHCSCVGIYYSRCYGTHSQLPWVACQSHFCIESGPLKVFYQSNIVVHIYLPIESNQSYPASMVHRTHAKRWTQGPFVFSLAHPNRRQCEAAKTYEGELCWPSFPAEQQRRLWLMRKKLGVFLEESGQ